MYNPIQNRVNDLDNQIQLLQNQKQAFLGMQPIPQNNFDFNGCWVSNFEGMILLKKFLNDYHFDEDMLKDAERKMENCDGTQGFHWTKEQVMDVFKNNKIDGYTDCDITYVMNMLYSDYSNVLGSDPDKYVKLTISFLNDKDAPEGKAARYYYSMK